MQPAAASPRPQYRVCGELDRLGPGVDGVRLRHRRLDPDRRPPDLTASLIALACTAAGAGLVGILPWRRGRRRAERRSARLLSHAQVSLPVSETVLPAHVWGEVPYSREGDRFLFVGPSGMAAGPAPGGMAGRSGWFPPLTFVRLHPAKSSDPRCGGLHDPLLVECRDGAREVLVAANREHVPWVLGGLRFQS